MPKEEAFRRTNLDYICPRIANTKWLTENRDVVLRLSDAGPRFCPLLGRKGFFLILTTILRARVPEAVKEGM
jgi:hypothetical protein